MEGWKKVLLADADRVVAAKSALRRHLQKLFPVGSKLRYRDSLGDIILATVVEITVTQLIVQDVKGTYPRDVVCVHQIVSRRGE